MTRTTFLAAGLFVGFIGGHHIGFARGSELPRTPEPGPAPSRPTQDAGTQPMSGPAAGPMVTNPPSSPTVPPALAASTLPAGVAAGFEADDCDTDAVWFARVAIGEVDSALATGEPTEDHAAILQTARNVAAGRGSTLGKALRALAPRLHGDREVSSERQRWVRTLPGCGDDRPSDGWTDCRDVGAGERCDGDWRLYAEGWDRFRAWAEDAVLAPTNASSCPGRLIAYGCSGLGPNGEDTRERCYDDPHALFRRDLCLLDCGTGPIHFWARDGEGCTRDDELTTAARVRAEAWCAEHADAEVCR